MKRLMGIGVCVGCALVLSGCGEQNKMKDPVKGVAAGAKGELEKGGISMPDVAGASKALQETATKAAEEAKAKITSAANKASEALGERFTKATEQASESLKSVKGAPEIIQQLGTVIPSLQQTLAGITDKESAQKAMPKLDELEGTVSKLSGQFGGLPEKAKQTVGDLIQKGTSGLQPLVDSVLALPAVQSIRPKLEAIMQQLKGLKG